MNQNEFEQLAELFKIFGTPTRLQILYALVDEEKCVYDIARELGMSQSAISHQKLTDAYDGDVKTLLNKLEAVAKAGREYETFTKKAQGTKGSVKFIFRTEAVKAQER